MKMRAPFRYWGAKALGREGWYSSSAWRRQAHRCRHRWPQVGWLLGQPKAPNYAPTAALAADPGPTVLSHHQIADAIEASEGDMRRFTALIDSLHDEA